MDEVVQLVVHSNQFVLTAAVGRLERQTSEHIVIMCCAFLAPTWSVKGINTERGEGGGQDRWL